MIRILALAALASVGHRAHGALREEPLRAPWPIPQEEFDPARVNKWILSLSDDPSQGAQVEELHAYLKKHGKLTLVYSKFEDSFERRPEDGKLRYLLARLQLRDGNRAGALKWLAAAAQADPEYAYTYLAQAEIYQEQGNEKELVPALEGVIQASKVKPAVVGAIRQLAAYYAKRQELDRAASLWAGLGEKYPADAALVDEAVRGIRAAGKLPRAIDCLRTALAAPGLAPADRARFFLDLSALERRLGRAADASRSLAEASKAAGDDPSLARKIDESVLVFHRDEDRLAELSAQREKDLSINPTNAIYVWRLARLRMAQNSAGQARDLLTAGLDKNPGNLLLLAALADVAAMQGKHAEVRELSVQLAAREPSVREHRRREGLACLELGKVDEADLCFRAYAVTAVERVDVARIYEARGRLSDAAIHFRRAIDLKPDPGWSRSLVGVLVRLDRLTDAEQEAVRCTPGDRERWALLRDLLVQQGDDEKACVYAKKDAEANPKDFATLVVLGKLQARNSAADAESTFRRALLLAGRGQRGVVFEELAGLAATQGLTQVTLLKQEILQRLKDQPDEGGYYYALFRLQPGRFEILEQGRRNDPKHVRLRQELAPYFMQLKQYDVAIDVYRELIEIDPNRRDHYVYAIGEVYWALGHKEEAFSWWAKVQGSARDKVGLSFQLAKKYESEKRYPQAIELLQQILREEPGGVLYHWTLARLYRQVNDLQGVMMEYKWILANSKDEGYLRTARLVLSEKLAESGRAYLDEGSFTRALEVFAEALRYAPDDPATGTLLGDIARTCERVRDYAKAAEYYHQILSRYPGILLAASPGRTMNAALFVKLQLRGNPECLKAYEDLVGPQAKALLQESIQKNDRAGLERLLQSYPMTLAAGEAAFWLAESWRKEGQTVVAASYLERLLSEFALAGVDEALTRIRLVELCALLKDWGTVSSQIGELAVRSKDRVVAADGKTIVVKEFIKHWQKEVASHGAGLGASWGLLGKDAKNSSSSIQELPHPLVQKWRHTASSTLKGDLITLPPVYAANGLVFLAKEDLLVALDGSSGVVRWSAPLRVLRMRAAQNTTIHGLTAGLEGRLAAAQGVVAGIDHDGEIRAFDASTGAALWSRSTDVPRADGLGFLKPATRAKTGILEHMEILSATRQCFIVREGDKLRSYALRTGRMDWQTDVQVGALPLAIDTGPGGGNFPMRLERHVLESEGVLIHGYGDSIRAIDSSTGRDLWEVKVAQKFAPGPSPWSAYFTLLAEGVGRATISGDLLIVLSASEGKLTAYELRTGRLRWELAGEALVTESQLASDDQNVYALVNKALTVYSAKTGVQLWRREAKNYAPPPRTGMPPPIVAQNRMTIAGSRIYLSSSEEQDGEPARLEAIDRRTGKTLWEHPFEAIGRLISGIRSVGMDLWGRPIPAQASAPVICDGWLHVVRSDGLLYAFHGKTAELAALREAAKREPESAQLRFQLGDLLGSEGQASLEIEEYRAALKLAQKRGDLPAMRDLIVELKTRLFARFMKQGEAAADFEAALKSYVEARAYADGESALARVLVRTAAVLLALQREMEAVDVLSSILVHCSTAMSPLEGPPESAGDYAKRQLAKLGPQAKAQWEKVHAEEMEKAFAPGKTVEELEKAIDRYSFSAKADQARVRAARVHCEQKRFKEAIQTLDKVRPEYLDQADAETYFDAWDLLARALAEIGEDRRALGVYQKMLADLAKDPARLSSIRERAESRHKELKESWERNGAFASPLQKIWQTPAPAAGAPKPAGPVFEAFRPSVDRGRLYVLDLQGSVQAIDASTSQLLWQAKSENFAPFFQNTSGLTVLPMDPLLVVKDAILAVGGRALRVFDAASGALLWSVPSLDGEGMFHQIVLEGNRVLTCDTKGRVSARDDRTGKLLWSVRPGTSATGIMTDRSGMSGGGLFHTRIGAEGTRVVAQPAGDPGTLFAYDLATGKLAWKTVDAAYPGFLKGRVVLEVGSGMVCFGDPAGVLACHDLSDGKLRWKLNLSAPVERLLAVPDRVVVATADQVVLYDAKTGRKQWAAAPDLNQPFSRDKDMRIGATGLASKGKWLVVASANAVSILDLATGQVKDQAKSEAQPPVPRPAGRCFPFGKSFASVVVGPEGIFWGLPSDSGCQWTLLR